MMIDDVLDALAWLVIITGCSLFAVIGSCEKTFTRSQGHYERSAREVEDNRQIEAAGSESITETSARSTRQSCASHP
jgi:hypothetical protein